MGKSGVPHSQRADLQRMHGASSRQLEDDQNPTSNLRNPTRSPRPPCFDREIPSRSPNTVQESRAQHPVALPRRHGHASRRPPYQARSLLQGHLNLDGAHVLPTLDRATLHHGERPTRAGLRVRTIQEDWYRRRSLHGQICHQPVPHKVPHDEKGYECLREPSP
jgi:hypothetical protein